MCRDPVHVVNTSRQGFRHALWLFVFALAVLAVAYWLRVVAAQPVLYDLGGGDAAEYDILAHYFLNNLDFKHIIFGLRPPLLPAFIAGVYALAGRQPYVVVFYNLIFGALTVVLTYKLAVALRLRRAVALAAALIVALDLAFIEATVTMMSEPLHNFLLAAALFWFVRSQQAGRWRALLAAGLFVAAALLVRPITVYFGTALALVIVAYRPRRWPQAAALVALCALPVLTWSARNAAERGSFSYSTSGPFTALYYKAVSVESHATGRDPNEVAAEIALEVEHRMGNSDVTYADVADFPVGRDADRFTTSAERERLLGQMATERFRRHPRWFAIMTGVSLARQFIPSVLPLPGWLQWAQIGLEVVLAAVGLVLVWLKRRRNWLLILLSHATVLYYLALPALSHAGLYTSRYRTPYLPFIALYAAIGLFALTGNPWKQQEAAHV